MMRKVMSVFIVVALLMTSVPAMAGSTMTLSAENGGDNGERNIVPYVVGAVVVGGVVLVGRYLLSNSRARSYYEQGDAYAAQGRWDLAADSYQKAYEIRRGFRDVEQKLANARRQAAAMFIAQGDAARAAERYEEALHLYQRALQYQPDSVQARSKADDVANDLVAVHYRRGRTYETQNRWEEAAAEYEKAYMINEHYQDLADRYLRAKARADGDLPLLGVLFFLNQSSQLGIESALIQALQTELRVLAPGRFGLADHRRVQSIVTEQAAALSDSLDDNLAMDFGRLLGTDQVLTGVIHNVETHRNRVRMTVSLKIMSVPDAQVLSSVEAYRHTFSDTVTLNNLSGAMPEIARELAERILR